MKKDEQVALFLDKAKQDEDLLDFVFTSAMVSDEIFGFHCQQAAEKLLKALLSHLGVPFRRTHNLRSLMDLLADNKHPLPKNLIPLEQITPYGALIRYEEPQEDDKIKRKVVRARITRLRKWVEGKIGA